MRFAFVSLALLCAGASFGEEMAPIPRESAHCPRQGSYCYEWKLIRDESIRFVATGHEDGGDWSFYRRDAEGHYRHLFSVYPAIKDDHHGGALFWGYAWDITDVVVAPGEGPIRLLATFDHTYVYESWSNGNWNPEKRQRSVPYVLFLGHTTQPGATEEDLPFQAMSIDEIRKEAKVNDSLDGAPGG